MQYLFNQIEPEKTERYIHNFYQLPNSGKGIHIGKEKEDIGVLASFIKRIKSIWNSFINLCSSKEDSIIGKIEELRNEMFENLENKERIINFTFQEEKEKIDENLRAILFLAFSDLSNVEEKGWIESKEQYITAKKYLLISFLWWRSWKY